MGIPLRPPPFLFPPLTLGVTGRLGDKVLDSVHGPYGTLGHGQPEQPLRLVGVPVEVVPGERDASVLRPLLLSGDGGCFVGILMRAVSERHWRVAPCR